jgi:hypothetical protein
MTVKYKFNRPDVKVWISAIDQILKSISTGKNVYNKAELHIRGGGTDIHENDLIVTSYAKIPKDHYYIKYYFMGEPKGLFDLCHNKDYKFVTNGRHPILLFMNDVDEKDSDVTVTLLTIGQFFRKAIYDRLNQIEYNVINNSSPARWDLLDGTKAGVFRYVENNPSNTLDHALRIANRIVIIPPHPELGSWDFNPHKNPHGSLTDCLDSPLINGELLKAFCKKIDLILGVGSEGSGIKNTLSEDTPLILQAKMNYPEKSELEIGNSDDRFLNDPMSYKDPKTGEIYSIFGKAQKTFARMKSLTFSNPNKFIGNDQIVEGHGYSFYRNHSYLHKDPNIIGTINHSDVDTTFNILAVFIEGPTEIRWNDGNVVDHKTLWQGVYDKDKNIIDDVDAENLIIEQLDELYQESGDNPSEAIQAEMNGLRSKLDKMRSPEMVQRRWENALSAFEMIDKNNLSLYANYADCHIDISTEVAEQLIVLNRSLELDLLPGAYTHFIEDIRQDIKAGKIVQIKDDQLDHILGYKVICEICSNDMVACNEEKVLQHFAEINQSNWFCSVCEQHKEIEQKDLKSKTFRKFNKFLKGLDIDSINLNDGVRFNSRLHLPLGIARAINTIGLKGVTFPVGEKVLGNVNAQMPHPETGEIINLDLKVDAIVPYGAIKGKNKAISLAEVAFVNAIFKTKYSPHLLGADEEFIHKFRDIYSKSKIVWTRKAYNPHTGYIETLSTPIRFGLINLSVTEVNSEFFKVRSESNPGKVSPLSLDYQSVLGFEELPDLIRKSSLESIDNPKQHRKLLSLIKAYKGDSK